MGYTCPPPRYTQHIRPPHPPTCTSRLDRLSAISPRRQAREGCMGVRAPTPSTVAVCVAVHGTAGARPLSVRVALSVVACWCVGWVSRTVRGGGSVPKRVTFCGCEVGPIIIIFVRRINACTLVRYHVWIEVLVGGTPCLSAASMLHMRVSVCCLRRAHHPTFGSQNHKPTQAQISKSF
jgi:hypothetical protein